MPRPSYRLSVRKWKTRLVHVSVSRKWFFRSAGKVVFFPFPCGQGKMEKFYWYSQTYQLRTVDQYPANDKHFRLSRLRPLQRLPQCCRVCRQKPDTRNHFRKPPGDYRIGTLFAGLGNNRYLHHVSRMAYKPPVQMVH